MIHARRACGLVAAGLVACAPGPAAEPGAAPVDDSRRGLAEALAAYEDALRHAAPSDPLPPWSSRSGADPFAIAAVSDGRALAVLRGRDAVVLLAADGRELARAVPSGARGWAPVAITAIAPDTFVVVGEGLDVGDRDGVGTSIVRVRVEGNALAFDRAVLRGVVSLRGVAWQAGTVFLADRHGGRILALDWPLAAAAPTAPARELARCQGAIGLSAHAGLLAAPCLLEHATWIGALADDGGRIASEARIVRDGPSWSVAIAGDGDDWRVATGGVEDHALDRTDGFGYVDSFVFLDRVRRCARGLCVEPIGRTDVGELGLVTPKWISITTAADRSVVEASGYGGQALARLTWGRDEAPIERTVTRVPPGLQGVATLADRRLAADPLLDRWVVLDDRGWHTAPADPGPDPRGIDERVGEALVFTELLAPHASADGRRSRFTCETCHFEGTGDGRIHYTGRGVVHATTKPLLGLFGNRPHFTRALDRTMAVMVDNEFAVANRGDPAGPDFAISPEDTPWIGELGVTTTLGPVELRKAMMRFFAGFTHDTNPAVRHRSGFSSHERRGAELFARHCERCHQARSIADDASSRVEPSRWEAPIFSEAGPIVWASETRVRTGVEPYVHDEGARPPSLRRTWLKRPYFTNGSAASLDDVLARARVGEGEAFVHDGAAPIGTRMLAPDERAALRAFLELL